jgi:hypothetical protein
MIKHDLLETVMNLFVRRRISHVAIITLAAALPIAAQEPRRLSQPDSIPLELAGALIASGGFGTEPQILVGMLPGWMNSRVFLPPNGRVLGSAFIGSITVGVLAVSDQPDVAIAQFKTELLKRGWKAPPPQPNYGGGFRPAPVNTFDATPVTRLTLCGGDEQLLMVNATRRSGTATQVTYRVTPTNSYGPCNPTPRPQEQHLPTPTLINPPDVSDFRNYGACSSMRAQSWGTMANVRTPMTMDALIEHYSKQMQDSGWRATPVAFGGRTWTRTDSTGALLEARLMAMTSPHDTLCRDLTLNIWSVKKP